MVAFGCSAEQVIAECRAIWSLTLDGGGEERAAAVAVTPRGNVILAGYALGLDFGAATPLSNDVYSWESIRLSVVPEEGVAPTEREDMCCFAVQDDLDG